MSRSTLRDTARSPWYYRVRTSSEAIGNVCCIMSDLIGMDCIPAVRITLPTTASHAASAWSELNPALELTPSRHRWRTAYESSRALILESTASCQAVIS